MRLAAKLILLFLVGLLLIVGVFSYVTLQRERQIAMEDHQRYAAGLADILQQSPVDLDTRPREVRNVQIRRVELTTSDRSHMPRVPLDRLVVTEQIITFAMPNERGQDTLYTYVPISDALSDGGDPREQSRIEISAPDSRSQSRYRRIVTTSLATLFGVTGLSAVVILLGGIRMVARPLDRLITKVNRISEGDFSVPVEVHSRDELGNLATAVNQMCDRLVQQREQIEAETSHRISAIEQLRHADRLRSVGRIAAGIAHEIGTPLNVVSGRAELIASGELSSDATRQSAVAIKTESDRISKTISSLLDFARQRPPDRSSTNIADVLRTTVELLRPLADKSGAVLRLELPEEPVTAEVDRAQFQQVATNLINNAVQSGDVGVHVDIGLISEADKMVLTVSDDGEGMSESTLEQLFEPFFTTKSVGEGNGLGLAISDGIVRDHDGEIIVHSKLGQGSTFRVEIPKHQSNRTNQEESK